MRQLATVFVAITPAWLTAQERREANIRAEQNFTMQASQTEGSGIETTTDLFSQFTQNLEWTQNRTWRSEGNLTAVITESDIQSAQNLLIGQGLVYEGRRVDLDLRGNYNYLKSTGLGFLTLSERFDRLQQIEDLDPILSAADTTIYERDSELSLNTTFRQTRLSTLAIAINDRVENTANALSDPLAEEEIKLRSLAVTERIGLGRRLSFNLTGEWSELELRSDTPSIQLDVTQDERLLAMGLNYERNERSSLGIGVFGQQVIFDEGETELYGPTVVFEEQLSGQLLVRQELAAVFIEFADDSNDLVYNRTTNITWTRSRNQSFRFGYDYRFQSTADIFELLADNNVIFDRRGFISETSTLGYTIARRRFTSSLEASHNNLFTDRLGLTFIETQATQSNSLRIGRRELFNFGLSGRLIDQRSLETVPRVTIVSANLGLAKQINKNFLYARSGEISSNIIFSQQKDDGFDSPFNRIDINFSATVVL